MDSGPAPSGHPGMTFSTDTDADPLIAALAPARRYLDRRAVPAAGHQAILEVRVLAQRGDQEIRPDDQQQHEGEPDHCRPAAVGFVAIIVRITHAGTLPGGCVARKHVGGKSFVSPLETREWNIT